MTILHTLIIPFTTVKAGNGAAFWFAPLFYIKKGIIFGQMALFGLTIQLDKKTQKLLKEINCKLDKLLKEDSEEKKKIIDKLDKATKDIESTV